MSEWKYRIESIGDDGFGLFLVRYPDRSEWRLILTMQGSSYYTPKLVTCPITAGVLARALGFDADPAVAHVVPKAGAEAIAETIAAHRQSPPGLGQIPARPPTTSAVPRSSATPKPAVVAPKRATTRLPNNWPVAIADRLRELREGQGQEYRDVVATLNKEFGTSYSLSAVKAKAARMKLSNYLEMAVESAPSAPDLGEGKASTPEEEGDVASPGPQPGAPPQVHPTHEDIIEAALSEHRLASEKRSSVLPDPDAGRKSPATFYPKVKVPTTIYDIITFWKYQGQAVEERPGGKYMLAGSTEEIDAAELVRRANTRRRAGGMKPFVLETEEVVPLHTEAAE